MLGFNKTRALFRFTGWFFLVNSLVFWLVGSSYLHAILASSSLFQNSIVDYSQGFHKVLVVAFALITYFSFLMLLAFIPAALVLLLAILIPSRRAVWMASIVAASWSVLWIVVDTQLFAMYTFHLNSTVLALIWNEHWKDVFDFSSFEVLIFGVVAGFIVVFEVLMAWIVWNKIVLAKRLFIGKTIFIMWLGGILLSYFTLMLSIQDNNNIFSQQTPNLPLFNTLLAYTIPYKNAQDILTRYSEHYFSQPLFSSDPLHYPLHPMHCKKPVQPYNIILLMVDSLRFDAVQSQYMPNLSRFGKDNWQFLQHISGGNATQPGLFSLFYGIPGNYWTAALQQAQPPLLMELLRQYGYVSKIIWSSTMLMPHFDKTLFLTVNGLNPEGAPYDPIAEREQYTTRQAVTFLRHPPSQPFFLHLFYDGPHGYCADRSFPERYKPVQPLCSRVAMTNAVDPLPYYNRYLNAVSFVDSQMEQVLQVIATQGYLDNSVVIITSDHGQEFNDTHQNYWGHASNFTAFQVHVPMIIHWPKQPAKDFNYITSGYDVVPTLLTRLFQCNNPVIDYSIGQDLLQETGRLPFVLVGSYVNMGLVEASQITTLQASGAIAITGKKAEPMPTATVNLQEMHKAMQLMRLYFQRAE